MLDKSFFKLCKNKFSRHKLCLVWFLLLHFLLLGLSVVSSFSPAVQCQLFLIDRCFPAKVLADRSWAGRCLLPFGQFRHPVQCGPRPQPCRLTHQLSVQFSEMWSTCEKTQCHNGRFRHPVDLVLSPAATGATRVIICNSTTSVMWGITWQELKTEIQISTTGTIWLTTGSGIIWLGGSTA